jgi:hypothetical protein
MTTPDIAGLCERLRRPGLKSAAEAADALERQAAEIERLRATLGYYSYADDGGKRARAALTGKEA